MIKNIAKKLLNNVKTGAQIVNDYTYVAKNAIKNALDYPNRIERNILFKDVESVPIANRGKYVEVGKLSDDKKISSDEAGALYSLLKSGKDVLLEPYYVRKDKNTSNFNWTPWQTENNMKKYLNIPRPEK